MISNWSDLTTLTSPIGSLTLNAACGVADRYLVNNPRCDGGADLRVTFDNIPQSDGQLNHRQYLTGYKMRLALELWSDEEPACGGDAQRMLDSLGAIIDALRNPDTSVGPARVVWTPEGMAARMINDICLMEKPVVTVEPGGTEGIVSVTFGVVSAFPYEMSEAEQTPATIANGATENLVNAGSTRFWPVFKVNGPVSAAPAGFTIQNTTTGKQIVYAGTAIGGGSYLEIDTFRGTAYLNGTGANLLDGFDFLNTDFFPLEPGTNAVSITGADCDVLWNNAWI